MTPRIYTLGKARVLELYGKLDLTVNLKPHVMGAADVSVALFEPRTAGMPFRPALVWVMGNRLVLQDDAQGDEAHAALWLNDTAFRVPAEQVPFLINFLGALLRDARHATTARASA